MDFDDLSPSLWTELSAIEPQRILFHAAFETAEVLGRQAGAIALGLLESDTFDPAAPDFRLLDLIVRAEHEFQLRFY